MLPYFQEPIIDLGFYQVPTFPILIGIAIVVQFQIVLRRAPKVGISRRRASTLAGWAIGLGLVSAHVLEVLWYTPEKVLENPLVLIELWGSLSSFGGMVGGLLGLYLVMRVLEMTRDDQFRFVDCLIFALPFTLAIGRLGCALKHDHPGAASNHWLAIDFPSVSRFDMGLLEFLFLVVVSSAFAWLGRRPRPDGFYIGLFFAIYGPVRFYLDSLRIAETRYLGWTPGQYMSIVAAIGGIAVLAAVLRRGPTVAALQSSESRR